MPDASLAQLGERQTEDLKVLCSIHRRSIFLPFCSVTIPLLAKFQMRSEVLKNDESGGLRNECVVCVFFVMNGISLTCIEFSEYLDHILIEQKGGTKKD